MKAMAFPAFLILLAMYPVGATRSEETPITRVVGLLTGLALKTELEGKMEEKLYENFVCWAKTIIDTKTATNAAANSKIDELEAFIADIEAGRIEFTSERTDLEKELKELNEEMESADKLRKEEHEQFLDAEDEMIQAIDALDKALIVLGEATAGHETGTLLVQRSQARLGLGEGFAERVQDGAALARAAELGQKFLTVGDALFLKRILSGDVPKADWKKLNRKATFKMHYKARSFKIQELLKEMNHTFTDNLATARKKEEESLALFEKLMESKTAQKDETEAALEKMEVENGSRAQNKDEAAAEVKALKEQVTNDDKFIEQTKASLAEKKQEWKDRQTLRAGEVAAMREAVAILSNDEAKDLATKSFKSQGYSLLQEDSMQRSSARAAMQKRSLVVELLHSVARNTLDLRLAALASRIASGVPDAFVDVIKSIDKMLATLKEEENTDLAAKEQCEEDRATDTRSAIVKSRAIDDASDLITQLTSELTELAEEIKQKEQQVADIKEQMAEMEKIRKEEHDEFMASDADDKAMAEVVGKAMKVLSTFYAENNLMFVQEPPEVLTGKAPPPPPTTWEAPYGGKTQQSTNVITALDIILTDIKKDISIAESAEKEAQAKYDVFVKESNEQLKSLGASITELTGFKGEKEGSKVTATEERASTKGDLDAVIKKIDDANPGCEYIAETYPTKRRDRQIEMDGLVKARGILEGAKFNKGPDADREIKPGDALFLQKRHK